MPTTVKKYAATLSWTGGVSETGTLLEDAARVARRYDLILSTVVKDPHNLGCFLVTFFGKSEDLVTLYCSDDGGNYAVSNITPDMIVEVSTLCPDCQGDGFTMRSVGTNVKSFDCDNCDTCGGTGEVEL